MRPRAALCTSSLRPRRRSTFDATRSTMVRDRPVRYRFETCASWMASGAVATSEGELVREEQRAGAAQMVVVEIQEDVVDDRVAPAVVAEKAHRIEHLERRQLVVHFADDLPVHPLAFDDLRFRHRAGSAHMMAEADRATDAL